MVSVQPIDKEYKRMGDKKRNDRTCISPSDAEGRRRILE
jgi:hypothetical protein